VTGPDLVALLERRGFDFFAGVPCSLIEDVSHPPESLRDRFRAAAMAR